MLGEMALERQSRVYVAGHRGLVGSALWRELTRRGFTHLIGRAHSELDLLDAQAVQGFFALENKQGPASAVHFTDISGYLKNSVVCPAGGTTFADSYTITDVQTKPACSSTGGGLANGHLLPSDTGA